MKIKELIKELSELHVQYPDIEVVISTSAGGLLKPVHVCSWLVYAKRNSVGYYSPFPGGATKLIVLD